MGLLSLFAWREVFRTGAHVYYENSRTGERMSVWRGHGYSPVDQEWLNGGERGGVPKDSDAFQPVAISLQKPACWF